MHRRSRRRLRAAILSVVYLVGCAGLLGALLPGAAAAAGSSITDCTDELGIQAAFTAGTGTWTFDCSGTIPITSTLSSSNGPLSVAVGAGQKVTLNGQGNLILSIQGGSVTLDGGTPGALTLTDGGGTLAPAVNLQPGSSLTLHDVTMTNSTAPAGQAPITVLATSTLTIGGSSFSGNQGDEGGVVDNAGTLTVSGSTFSSNQADYHGAQYDSGGAIFSTGTLTVTGSTFTGNQAFDPSETSPNNPSTQDAYDAGGAIYVGGGSAAVSDSTFTTNQAFDGGAIYANYGDQSLTVGGSTFSGNIAYEANVSPSFNPTPEGGAVYVNSVSAAVYDSTLYGNRAGASGSGRGQGGGLYVDLNTPASVSSVTFAGNLAYAGSGSGDNFYWNGLDATASPALAGDLLSDANGPGGNCGATVTSPGFGGVPFPAGNHDLQYGDTTCSTLSGASSGWTTADPLLQPLAANGGPTQTMALGAGSPAIGQGDPSTCTGTPDQGLDQRGAPRTASLCDIGAYQTEPLTLTVNASPSSVYVNGTSTVSGKVSDPVHAVANQTVDLSLPTGSGTLLATTVTTGTNGSYSTTYTAPATVPAVDPVTVSAKTYDPLNGPVSATVPITVQAAAPATPSAEGISIAATPSSVQAGATSTVTGVVYGTGHAPLPNTRVDLTTSAGSVNPTSETTNGSGQYTTQLTAPGTAQSVTVTATVYGSTYSAATVIAVTAPSSGGGGGVSFGGGGGGSGPPSGSCATLTLPQGSPLSVSSATSGAPDGLPADARAASCVFTLQGSSPATPETVTIGYDGAALQGLPPARLSIFRLRTGDLWTFLPTAVDPQATTVSATVRGPATLVVLADIQRLPDVPSGYSAKRAIDTVAGAELIDGFPPAFAGPFKPDGTVTRAQAVKMVVLLAQRVPEQGSTPFGDVPTGAWYAPYVASAYAAGIVRGESGTTLRPEAPVTREAFAVLLARALHLSLSGTAPLPFTDAGRIDAWALPAVQAVVAAGYFDGFPGGKLDPRQPLTRAQAADVLARVIAKQAPAAQP